MIRNLFIMFAVVITVGFTPAVAQNYYNKKTIKEPGSKPSLFNKPVQKPKTFIGEQIGKIKYKDKLKLKQQKIASLTKAQSLEEIHELGLKPTNAEELMFYAQASRAVTQGEVYKRREALMVHLQKQKQKLQAKIANQQAAALKVPGDTAKAPIQLSAPEKENPPKKAKKSGKPKLFVKSKEDKAKPTKVFTGYR